MGYRRAGFVAAAAVAALGVASTAHALVINDDFDSSITSDPNAGSIESAIHTASRSIAKLYSNDTHVSILFEYDPGDFLGETESTLYLNNIGQYNAASEVDSNAHPENLPLAEGLAHLSTGEGHGANENIVASSADLRALGENAPGGYNKFGMFTGSGPIDAVVTLSSTFPLNFTQTIPAYDGSNFQYSAINAMEHEIDEVLGGGGAGSTLNLIWDLRHGLTTGNPAEDALLLKAVGPLDRFRYSAPGVPSFTTDPNVDSYFSLDGGVSSIVNFNQYHQGDYGDFGPTTSPCPAGGNGGPGFIQDAFGCNNQPFVTFARGIPEDTMLQSIGWNPSAGAVPEPATWTIMLAGFGAVGGLLRRRSRALA